jgi:hypothetical protein
MGAWLPYRCVRRFLPEFFPMGNDPPWHETIRRRATRVGAGLERETLTRAVPPSETITVSVDPGHVRTFEVLAAHVSNDDPIPAACLVRPSGSTRS